MEKGDLKFVQTFNVARFKQNNGITQIDIKRNEKTGKNFFVFGFSTGAVSDKFAEGKLDRPVISEVIGEGGKAFYLLHNQGEVGGATTVATL